MGPTIPLVKEGSGNDRAAFIADLIALAAFYTQHGDAPLPGKDADGRVTLPVPVPGTSRGERIEALAEIAEQLGVCEAEVPDPVTGKRNGALEARRPFSRIAVVARVSPEGSRHLTDRQDELHLRLVRADADAVALHTAALDEADLQMAEEAHATIVIAEAGTGAAA
jgi:hypothetical protein